MTGFTENALVRKLQELNSRQKSIHTLSLWLIHHRIHHGTVVETWFNEMLKVKDGRQLTFMYLANDIIQNSKLKGPEYIQEFGKVLVESFKHMAKTEINAETKKHIHRILTIWQMRGVYDAAKIQEFKEAVDPNDALPAEKTTTKRKSTNAEVPEAEEIKKKQKEETQEAEHERLRSEPKVEVVGTIETHAIPSTKTPTGNPSRPVQLVKALLGLEPTASSHETVRELIASLLPTEVPEVKLLISKLKGKITPYCRMNLIILLISSMIKSNQEVNDCLSQREYSRQETLRNLEEIKKLEDYLNDPARPCCGPLRKPDDPEDK